MSTGLSEQLLQLWFSTFLTYYLTWHPDPKVQEGRGSVCVPQCLVQCRTCRKNICKIILGRWVRGHASHLRRGCPKVFWGVLPFFSTLILTLRWVQPPLFYTEDWSPERWNRLMVLDLEPCRWLFYYIVLSQWRIKRQEVEQTIGTPWAFASHHTDRHLSLMECQFHLQKK